MAWPPSDIGTGNTDAGVDNPQVARNDILGLMQGFNQLRNHFSTFMRGLAEAVDAPAARTALGATTVGSNVFTAPSQAAARTAVDAAALGVNNTFTGYQRFGSDAPWLRCKKLTGTTAGSEGFNTAIAHGLNQSKVISVTVHVWDSFNGAWIPHGYTLATEREFHWRLSASDINVSNSNTNSGAILNAAIRVLIWYEE